MRIGIYLGYPFPVNLDGEGIGRYVVRLTEGFLKQRPETSVHILVMPPNILETEKMFARLKIEFAARLSIHCSCDLTYINSRIPADCWIIPWIGLKSALELVKPLIVCLHDLAHLHVAGLDELYLLYDAAGAITEKAAAVIFNSEYIRTCDGMGHLGLAREKTYVIRPAPPSEEYQTAILPERADFCRRYGLNKNYLVYPTIIRPHKNHRRLIEAFATFSRRQQGFYLVFTDLRENYFRNLKACGELPDMAAEVPDDVKFIGRLPAGDVPALYGYAVGTVVPTLFEGSCPFPIMESLLMDTPVAFGRIEVALEVIQDTEAFITFDPYDVNDIDRGLAELALNGGAAQKQKAALSGFLARSWQDVAKEYYNMLEQALI